MASSKREACVRATCARPPGSHGRGLRRPARPVDSACTLYTCTLSAAAFAGMLALDVGVPGTDPMWHMYHWRGSVGTRGTARPGPVGRRVYRPAPGRGNGRTPGELWGLAERRRNRTGNPIAVKRQSPESAMARCGLLVWLWIRVTVRPEKRKRNVEMAPPPPRAPRCSETRGRRRRPGRGVSPKSRGV